MATRNARGQFARKSTVVDHDDDIIEERYAQYRSMFEDFGLVKYPLAGAIVNIAVSALGIYSGYITAIWLGFGAMLLSGSAFLGLLIALIAGVIFAIQALRAGSVAGAYVATGRFEHDYQKAKGWLSSKFEGSKTFAASKFSTTH